MPQTTKPAPIVILTPKYCPYCNIIAEVLSCSPEYRLIDVSDYKISPHRYKSEWLASKPIESVPIATKLDS